MKVTQSLTKETVFNETRRQTTPKYEELLLNIGKFGPNSRRMPTMDSYFTVYAYTAEFSSSRWNSSEGLHQLSLTRNY